jgi:hypothetical protein
MGSGFGKLMCGCLKPCLPGCQSHVKGKINIALLLDLSSFAKLSLSYHPSRACCAPCLPRNVPIEFLTRFVCHSKKPIQLRVVRFSISHVVVHDGLIRMMLSVPSSRVAARLLWYAARMMRLREENARRSDTVFHPTHLCRSGLVRPRIDHGRTLRRC